MLAPFLAMLMLQAASSAAPRGVVQASTGNFHVIHIAVPDRENFEREWAVTTPGANVTSTDRLRINAPTWINILFSGCKPGTDGKCKISTRLKVMDPAGKVYDGLDGRKVTPLFNGTIPEPSAIYLGNASLGIRIEPGERTGTYQMTAITTDEVAGVSVTTQLSLNTEPAK